MNHFNRFKKGRDKKKESPISFLTDVATLMGGTTLAQIIIMISAPMVTRLYGADAFGLSALFTSLVGTIAIIACLRYELTIMLPETDDEAANLLALSLLITSVISVILIPIMWVFGGNIASLLGTPALRPYLWFVPLLVFLTGSFSAINYWNSRKRQFGRLSAVQVTKAAATSGAQLGIGFAGYVSGGALIISSIVGQAISTSILSYRVWRSDSKMFLDNINAGRIAAGLMKYKDFPKIDVWSALVNTLSSQMPIFILSAFFSTTIVGYYSLGYLVLQLPMTFVGGAIAQVFFQRAAEANNLSMSVFIPVVESTIRRLIIIGFFPLLLLTIAGREIFIVVFGIAWAEAGIYAQILSFTILMSFITSPITTLFTVKKRLRAFLLFNILIMVSRAAPLIWGGLNDDIYLGLIALSVFGGIAYIGMGYWILNQISISFTDIIVSVYRPILFGCAILSILAISKYLLGLDPIMILMIGLLGFILYFYLVLIKDSEVRQIIGNLI